jgi:hypothetical protein
MASIRIVTDRQEVHAETFIEPAANRLGFDALPEPGPVPKPHGGSDSSMGLR